jgi:hypothetical protein
MGWSQWRGASRFTPAEDDIAHIIQEATASRLVLAADLRLQFLYACISAPERLVLNQRRLHECIDCMGRLSQSICNEALGIWVAGIIFHLGQAIE